MLIIANSSGASVVDAQITGNGWRSVQALDCKFTDKPSRLEEGSLNCPASTASEASAAHRGPINIMEALSPPLTSSSVTHNHQKFWIGRGKKAARAPTAPTLSPSSAHLTVT